MELEFDVEDALVEFGDVFPVFARFFLKALEVLDASGEACLEALLVLVDFFDVSGEGLVLLLKVFDFKSGGVDGRGGFGGIVGVDFGSFGLYDGERDEESPKHRDDSGDEEDGFVIFFRLFFGCIFTIHGL